MTVTLLHGKAEELVHTLEDGSVNCVIADPPYGINFKSYMATAGRRKNPHADRWAHHIENDHDLDAALALCDEVVRTLVTEKMVEHGDLYIFTAWNVLPAWHELANSWADIGVKYQMLLVWEKGYVGLGDIDGSWGCGHELILYCKKGRREVPFRRSGVIHVDRLPPGKNIHPTEKPVALIERLLEMSTDPGDLVVDPFAGSGSTLVACQRTGRRAIGFEKKARYYKDASERLTQQYFF